MAVSCEHCHEILVFLFTYEGVVESNVSQLFFSATGIYILLKQKRIFIFNVIVSYTIISQHYDFVTIELFVLLAEPHLHLCLNSDKKQCPLMLCSLSFGNCWKSRGASSGLHGG